MMKSMLSFLMALLISTAAALAQNPPTSANPGSQNKTKNVWAGDNFEQVCTITATGSPGTFTPTCPSNNITITASGQTVALPTVGTPPGYQPGQVTKSVELNIFYAAPYVPIFAAGYGWVNSSPPVQCTAGASGCLSGVVTPNPDLIECRTAGETAVRCGPPLTALGANACFWSATQLNSSLTGGGTTTVTFGGTTGTYRTAYGASSKTTGKFYWETTNNGVTSSGDEPAGIGNTSSSIADGFSLSSGTDTVGAFAIPGNGQFRIYYNGAIQSATGNIGAASGDRVAHALDLTNGYYWAQDLTRSSGWIGASTGANPATPSGGFNLNGAGVTVLAHPVVPGITLFNTGDTGVSYFASSSWTGTPPSGFGTICGL